MVDRFDVKFDRVAFWEDVRRARGRQQRETPVGTYLRERGLRFIVETKGVLSIDAVRSSLVEAWGQIPVDQNVSVVRLFQMEQELPAPEHLNVFNLVTIENVEGDDLDGSPYDACYALMLLPLIVSVEPDLPYLGFFVPDPMTDLGAGFGKDSEQDAGQTLPTDRAWALRNMRVDAAWQISPIGSGERFGAGVRIAHLDTGWTDHDDLDVCNFAKFGIRDFLDAKGDGHDPLIAGFGLNPGHGTRTGSVMMSRGGVSLTNTTSPGEITGVAPDSTYVPKRCIKSVIVIFAGDIARAVLSSTMTDCHVISMSLGGRPAKALQVAIQDAVSNHLLVVAAAGNKVPGRLVVWPAAYPECIAMAATNEGSTPWTLSSKGRAIDVSAPGVDVWVAEPTDPPVGVNVGSGTSYATAHAAGVAALWLAFFHRDTMIQSLKPGVLLQEVFRTHLKDSARTPGGWDAGNFGTGIIDAEELLRTPPTVAVALGFGTSKFSSVLEHLSHPFFLAFFREILAWRLIDSGFFEVFEHELCNLAIEHGGADATGSPYREYRQELRMSRTLEAILRR